VKDIREFLDMFASANGCTDILNREHAEDGGSSMRILIDTREQV